MILLLHFYEQIYYERRIYGLTSLIHITYRCDEDLPKGVQALEETPLLPQSPSFGSRR